MALEQVTGSLASLVFTSESAFKDVSNTAGLAGINGAAAYKKAVVVPIVSESLKYNRNQVESKTIRSTRDGSAPARGQVDVAGDINIELDAYYHNFFKHIIGETNNSNAVASYQVSAEALPLAAAATKTFKLKRPIIGDITGSKQGTFGAIQSASEFTPTNASSATTLSWYLGAPTTSATGAVPDALAIGESANSYLVEGVNGDLLDDAVLADIKKLKINISFEGTGTIATTNSGGPTPAIVDVVLTGNVPRALYDNTGAAIANASATKVSSGALTLSSTAGGLLVTEKSSRAAVAATGDFYYDIPTKTISFWNADTAVASTAVTFTAQTIMGESATDCGALVADTSLVSAAVGNYYVDTITGIVTVRAILQATGKANYNYLVKQTVENTAFSGTADPVTGTWKLSLTGTPIVTTNTGSQYTPGSGGLTFAGGTIISGSYSEVDTLDEVTTALIGTKVYFVDAVNGAIYASGAVAPTLTSVSYFTSPGTTLNSLTFTDLTVFATEKAWATASLLASEYKVNYATGDVVTGTNLNGGTASYKSVAWKHTYKIGDLATSFFIEKQFRKVSISGNPPYTGMFIGYSGCRVNTFKVSVKPEGMIDCTISVMGANELLSTTTQFSNSQLQTLNFGHRPFDGFGAKIQLPNSNGVMTDLGIATSLDFTLSNNLDGNTYVIDRTGTRFSLPSGTVKIDGSLTALFMDGTLYKMARDNTATSLELSLVRGEADTTPALAGTLNNEMMVFKIPELLFKPESPVITGPQGLMVTLSFIGYYTNNAEGASFVCEVYNSSGEYAA